MCQQIMKNVYGKEVLEATKEFLKIFYPENLQAENLENQEFQGML